MRTHRSGKRSMLRVEVRKAMRPRLEAVQAKYGLSEAEAVELGLNLAVAASDGVLVRVFGPSKDRDGRVTSLRDVLRQMTYCGQKAGS